MDLPLPASRGWLRTSALGDTAVTVEFGREIAPHLNDRALAFAQAVRSRQWEGVLDIVPAYASVSIHVNPLQLPISILSERLHHLSCDVNAPSSVRNHRIPVLYGGEWGPDVEDVAAFARRSPADTIRLHHSTPYRVYMLRFSPGFPYVGRYPSPSQCLASPHLVRSFEPARHGVAEAAPCYPATCRGMS
jgi:KipI family sensor histidine kinase inhibitor